MILDSLVLGTQELILHECLGFKGTKAPRNASCKELWIFESKVHQSIERACCIQCGELLVVARLDGSLPVSNASIHRVVGSSRTAMLESFK